MTERQHQESGEDHEQQGAANHGSVGKAPLVASAASAGSKGGKDKKGLLAQTQAALDAEVKKLEGKLLKTVVTELTKQLKERLDNTETSADRILKEHLDSKSCDQHIIDLLISALNTKRLHASLRAVSALGKAVKAEKELLADDDKSGPEKVAGSFRNAGEIFDALIKYAKEIQTANQQWDKIAKQSTECHAKMDPLLKKLTTPQVDSSRKKFPTELPIAPDVKSGESYVPHVHLNLNGTVSIG